MTVTIGQRVAIKTETPINVTVTVPSGASAREISQAEWEANVFLCQNYTEASASARFDEELLIQCFRTLRQDGAVPRTDEFAAGWDEFLFANLEINTYQDLTREEKDILESAEDRWVGMLAQMEGAHD